MKGGANGNPTCLGFRATWRRLLQHQEFKSGLHGNCEAREASASLLTIDDCASLEDVVDDVERAALDGSEVQITVQLEDGFIPLGKDLPLPQRHIIYKQAG